MLVTYFLINNNSLLVDSKITEINIFFSKFVIGKYNTPKLKFDIYNRNNQLELDR